MCTILSNPDLFQEAGSRNSDLGGKDIALKVQGKAPLLDLAENWHGDRSSGPEQCSNDPQTPISTA